MRLQDQPILTARRRRRGSRLPLFALALSLAVGIILADRGGVRTVGASSTKHSKMTTYSDYTNVASATTPQ
ncbi:MAG: hypothetical protein LC746_15775 [Acidobacteria bacterium]|nr:hypothetical protein [Acidobacteriota bacterium]